MKNHTNRKRDQPGRNPKPSEIAALRITAGLTQTQAADLLHATLRTFQQWEAAPESSTNRKMHPAFWELFRIKIDGKPSTRIDQNGP